MQARKGFNVIAHRQQPRQGRERAVERAARAASTPSSCRCPTRSTRGRDRRAARRRARPRARAARREAGARRDPPRRHDLPRAARRRDRDGKTKLKSPSGTLSTAEAISVVNSGLAMAGYFGDGVLRAGDVAAGLIGADRQRPGAGPRRLARIPRDGRQGARRLEGPLPRLPGRSLVASAMTRPRLRHPPPRAGLRAQPARARSRSCSPTSSSSRGRPTRRTSCRCSRTPAMKPPVALLVYRRRGARAGPSSTRSPTSRPSGRRSATRSRRGIPVALHGPAPAGCTSWCECRGAERGRRRKTTREPTPRRGDDAAARRLLGPLARPRATTTASCGGSTRSSSGRDARGLFDGHPRGDGRAARRSARRVPGARRSARRTCARRIRAAQKEGFAAHRRRLRRVARARAAAIGPTAKADAGAAEGLPKTQGRGDVDSLDVLAPLVSQRLRRGHRVAGLVRASVGSPRDARRCGGWREVARLLRDEDLDASSASVIEAVRLGGGARRDARSPDAGAGAS